MTDYNKNRQFVFCSESGEYDKSNIILSLYEIINSTDFYESEIQAISNLKLNEITKAKEENFYIKRIH